MLVALRTRDVDWLSIMAMHKEVLFGPRAKPSALGNFSHHSYKDQGSNLVKGDHLHSHGLSV